MTSGYNHGNLIKSIVLAGGNSTNDAAITGRSYRQPGRRQQTFLSRQRKIEVIKVRREKTNGTESEFRLFYPSSRELETTFHARALSELPCY